MNLLCYPIIIMTILIQIVNCKIAGNGNLATEMKELLHCHGPMIVYARTKHYDVLHIKGMCMYSSWQICLDVVWLLLHRFSFAFLKCRVFDCQWTILYREFSTVTSIHSHHVKVSFKPLSVLLLHQTQSINQASFLKETSQDPGESEETIM